MRYELISWLKTYVLYIVCPVFMTSKMCAIYLKQTIKQRRFNVADDPTIQTASIWSSFRLSTILCSQDSIQNSTYYTGLCKRKSHSFRLVSEWSEGTGDRWLILTCRSKWAILRFRRLYVDGCDGLDHDGRRDWVCVRDITGKRVSALI